VDYDKMSPVGGYWSHQTLHGAGWSRKTSRHFKEARSRLVYGMTSGPARSEWSWFRFLVSHVDFFPERTVKLLVQPFFLTFFILEKVKKCFFIY